MTGLDFASFAAGASQGAGAGVERVVAVRVGPAFGTRAFCVLALVFGVAGVETVAGCAGDVVRA